MCQKMHALVHMSIQVQRKHSGLPCAMALRLIRALPGDPACLTPLLTDRFASVTPTLRRQDHTTSPCARRHTSGDLTRPSLPCPTPRDDRETPLLAGQDGGHPTRNLSLVKN